MGFPRMTKLPDFSKAHVLVVGDVMLDSYWQGATTRISPEAPVPVVLVQNQEVRIGGAGNVAVNVAGLGGQVDLLGLVGDDDVARQLEKLLQQHKVSSNLHRVPGSQTINKLRILSRHQQLIRVDFEDHFPTWEPGLLLKSFKQAAKTAQVAIFSDYAKGALRGVQALITHARSMHLPVVVDPKGKDFEPYRGATLLTPNFSEFEAVVGHCSSEDEFNSLAEQLRQSLGLHALLVTRSEQGMSLFVENQIQLRLPTHAREVFDVTGAGDTVAAVIGAGLASGLGLVDAVSLANLAAGIVVGKMGTAAVTVKELRAIFV